MSCRDLFLYRGRPSRADRVCVSTCRGPRALTDHLEPPRWGEARVPLVAAPWGSVQRPRRPPRGGNPTAADDPGRGGGGAGTHGGARSPDRGVSCSARRGEAAPGEKRSKGCGSGEAVRRAPRGVGPRCALPPPGKGRAWAVESGRRGPFGQGLGSVCRPRPVHQAALPGRVPSFSSQTPAARALGEACPPSATPHHSGRAASAGSRAGGGREGGLRSAAGGGCPALVSLHPPPRPAPPEQPLRAHVAASVLVGSQEWVLPISAVSPSRMSGGGSVYTVAAQTVVTRRHSQAVSRRRVQVWPHLCAEPSWTALPRHHPSFRLFVFKRRASV